MTRETRARMCGIVSVPSACAKGRPSRSPPFSDLGLGARASRALDVDRRRPRCCVLLCTVALPLRAGDWAPDLAPGHLGVGRRPGGGRAGPVERWAAASDRGAGGLAPRAPSTVGLNIF